MCSCFEAPRMRWSERFRKRKSRRCGIMTWERERITSCSVEYVLEDVPWGLESLRAFLSRRFVSTMSIHQRTLLLHPHDLCTYWMRTSDSSLQWTVLT